ncbi:MAG: sulfurtransferase [Phycisphaerae bacterium]|nr:sulfurtransferase [Phycisphaerae bacterium]NIX30127.1 sulfurtransferase [Phycisphaerae bacterium]
MGSYAHPEALVSTDWVAENLNNPDIRLVESNEDILLYNTGHIPGAVHIDWVKDLNDPLIRDYVDGERFAQLMSANGIDKDTTVVFYGNKSNWWACYALWVFNLFGHTNCKIMNGGRDKWIAEGRELTTDIPSYPKTDYPVPTRNDAPIRAFREDVLKHVEAGGTLVDVRSPGEYNGTLLHMPDYPQEGALRGGHIPSAENIPWAQATNEDGTFKAPDELKALYEGKGVAGDKDIVAYCRIGERSSHTWFVLTHLLGYKNVRNYDGSWTEWGNTVGLPIEK